MFAGNEGVLMQAEVNNSERELKLRAKMLKSLLRKRAEYKEILEVLLVEDNYFDYQILLTALEAAGLNFHYIWVKDGQEALDYIFNKNEFINAPSPDLIFLDLYMAGLDGCETLKRIKASGRGDDCIIVMHSNSVHSSDVELAYNLGANSYLQKTIDFRELVEQIKSLAKLWLGMERQKNKLVLF